MKKKTILIICMTCFCQFAKASGNSTHTFMLSNGYTLFYMKDEIASFLINRGRCYAIFGLYRYTMGEHSFEANYLTSFGTFNSKRSRGWYADGYTEFYQGMISWKKEGVSLRNNQIKLHYGLSLKVDGYCRSYAVDSEVPYYCVYGDAFIHPDFLFKASLKIGNKQMINVSNSMTSVAFVNYLNSYTRERINKVCKIFEFRYLLSEIEYEFQFHRLFSFSLKYQFQYLAIDNPIRYKITSDTFTAGIKMTISSRKKRSNQ